MLLTGREMELPVDVMFARPADDSEHPTVQVPDYVTDLEERLRTIYKLVRNKLKLTNDQTTQLSRFWQL